MVATFAIFRLVIDHTVNNFNFTHIVVALEVGGIIIGIPQAEFDGSKGGQFGRGISRHS